MGRFRNTRPLTAGEEVLVQYRETDMPACGELVMDYGAVPGLDAIATLPGRRRKGKRRRRSEGVRCEASVLLVLEVPQALPHAVELEDLIDDMELSRPHPVTMGLATNTSSPLPPGIMETGRLIAMGKAEMKAFTRRTARHACVCVCVCVCVTMIPHHAMIPHHTIR